MKMTAASRSTLRFDKVDKVGRRLELWNAIGLEAIAIGFLEVFSLFLANL